MGSYLLFRLVDRSPEHVAAINEWLREQPEYDELNDGVGDRREFEFWSEEDLRLIREEQGKDALSLYPDIGEGKFKVSGLTEEDPDRIKELWARLFDKLHDHTTVEVYSTSCALGYAYFSREQVATITNDGDALRGENTTLADVFAHMDGAESRATPTA